jgi:ADP-heptose:LPS heptosyltransferase
MRKNKKIKNILIINPFGIGDVLFSLPLTETLRNNFKDAFICYICNKRTRDILRSNPDIDEVTVFEKDEYRDLFKKSKKEFFGRFFGLLSGIRKKRFDLAVDLSMGHQYSFFLMFLGVPLRIGFNYKGRGRFLTHKLDFSGFENKSIAEYYMDILSLIGIERKREAGIKINTSEDDKNFVNDFLISRNMDNGKKTVCIAPGGGMSFGKNKINFKRWDAEGFSRLSDMISENLGANVMLIWGPGEEGLIKEITDNTVHKPAVAPPTTVTQMAELMRRSDVCVCNDAGPLHVAVGSGCRTVSVFGPSDERVYGPYPFEGHEVVTSKVECRPCYVKFKLPECDHRKCLKNIKPQDVFEAVKRILAK